MINNLKIAGAAPDIYNPVIEGILKNSYESSNPVGFLEIFVPRIIGLLLMIGSLAFFFMLLWGAISWILSGGDKAGLESAKGRITHALIGFVLMVAIFALVKLIEKFFGIHILTIDMSVLIK